MLSPPPVVALMYAWWMAASLWYCRGRFSMRARARPSKFAATSSPMSATYSSTVARGFSLSGQELGSRSMPVKKSSPSPCVFPSPSAASFSRYISWRVLRTSAVSQMDGHSYLSKKRSLAEKARSRCPPANSSQQRPKAVAPSS